MNYQELKKTACKVRMGIIEGVYNAKSGHPGGSLGLADTITYLYMKHMNIDPNNPDDPNRDRFVLSKGHNAPALYSVLAHRGFFPADELKTLRKIGSRLQGHPVMGKAPGVDFSTGSLGQGISAACGMALAGKQDGKDYKVYCVLGDGEIQEVYADEKMDCLKYRENGLGERFLMVRPYRQGQAGSVKDTLMAPVRLLKAVGGFLKVFTMRYGGENLRSDGAFPAQARQKSDREMFIEGNLIQADRLLRENTQRGDRYPGIVPKDWQLVRLTADGGREIVKHGVIDYALYPNGGFVYTNGQYVVACSVEGKETELLKMPMVTRVVVVPEIEVAS